MNKFKVQIILLLLIFVLVPNIMAYKMEPLNNIVHQYITNESQEVWKLIPYEIKNHLSGSLLSGKDSDDYNIGDNIINGSSEEDHGTNPLRHFWEPDNPNVGRYSDGLLIGYKSNWEKANDLWYKKCKSTQDDCEDVISNYLRGNINQSYYYLGRIIHLIEDATVPAHMHKDAHPNTACTNPGDDILECFTVLQNYWGHGDYNYKYFDGVDYENKSYEYEDLISSFSRSDWEAINPRIKEASYPSELFKLFWYVAQKTQYFASDDRENNTFYRKSGSSTQYQLPNLWSNEGITEFVTQSQIKSEDDDNEGLYVARVANATIPHAMKSVAGLYRLFWDAVHIDWPTDHHDYRRTGFTLLKGDMDEESDVDKVDIVLKGNLAEDIVARPSVADLDNNGYQDVVTVIHDKYSETGIDVYAVERNKKGGCYL